MEKRAVFAGGCFWCMVKPFEQLEGVKKVEVGYMDGYQVSQVIYNNEKIKYKQLLDTYWNQIDPTDDEGQFGDKGNEFKTAIFYENREEEKIASEYKERLEEDNTFGYMIFTNILPLTKFEKAEEFHQDFYKKHSLLYEEYYRFSGRYDYIKRSYAKRNLSNIQYEVTQNKFREKPFDNKYYDNFEEGIYVDVIDGRPLFSSKDKLKGNYGYPTFSRPINDDDVILIKDDEIINKIEVRSKNSDIHLGYVVNDTLKDFRNRVLSINSSALKFISKDKII